MELTGRNRTIAIAGAGVLALLVLWRWYSNRGGAAAPSDQVPDGTAGADYSQLAGQEQADTAALGNAMSGLQQTETADIGDITAQLGGLAAQEGADVSALSGAYGGLSDQLGGLSGNISTLTEQVNAIASGQAQATRTATQALTKAREAAWNANPRHTVTFAQHEQHLAHAGDRSHQGTGKQGGSVAPNTHERKPHVKAKAKTNTHPSTSHAQTPKSKAPTSAKPGGSTKAPTQQAKTPVKHPKRKPKTTSRR